MGFATSSAGRIPPRAGLSREESISSPLLDGTALAEIFEDKGACFAAAYADGVERLEAAVEAAVGSARERSGATSATLTAVLAAGLGAALELLAAEPPLAHLLLVESMAAGGPLRIAHKRSLERLADFLRQAPLAAGGEPLPPEMAPLLAGGLASHLAGRVLAGEAERLPESRELLLGYLLTPLLAATRPVAASRAAAG